MKILHVFNSLKYSGAEIMYVDAASFFYEKGVELTVLSTNIELGDYCINFINAGYSILHLPMPLLKQFFKRIKYYLSIIELLKSKNFDIIHIHSFPSMWGFALCARFCNIKSVYTFHNVFPSNFYSYPYHVLLRWTAKNIFKCSFHTISDSVFNHEKNFYFNKTIKIYNWYGYKRYFPGTDMEKIMIRKELNISSNALVLISVGGCSSIKRHSEILKALQIILRKIPDTIYLHLGKGDSECDEKTLAKSLELDSNVIFCDNQLDVRKFLIASDMYLMPSKFEGMPITTIEAMACGIPSILYDVPGLRDFNFKYENCLLIEENFEKLAESIMYLNFNFSRAYEISNSALNFVKINYGLQNNASQIFELYQSKY